MPVLFALMYMIFIILTLDSSNFAFILFGPILIIMNILCNRFVIYVKLLKSHFIDSYTIYLVRFISHHYFVQLY